MRDALLKEQQLVLINGMGGIGKTTLAAVYVSELYDQYDHIVWLTLEATLEKAIAAIHSFHSYGGACVRFVGCEKYHPG